MKKLVIVGSQNQWAIETYYIKYLRSSGIEVFVFDPSAHYKLNSVTDKIKFRYFPKKLYAEANKALITYINDVLPPIVWIFKGLEIFPSTLKNIRSKGIILVNYNPDHPFIRTYAGTGGINIEKCVPLYNVHFAYNLELIESLINDYKIKSYWLPFGYDLSENDYEIIQNQEEMLKVCFIGNPDKIRASIIQLIAAEGIEVHVYGHNWNKFLKASKYIQIFDQVFGIEFWKSLRKYRIQLNIFRAHNINSHNMRSFEIPACGGIQVAPYSNEHEFLFNEGRDIFMYKNENDILKITEYLLQLSTVEANKIRMAARKCIIKGNHSYYHRAMQVREVLFEEK